MTTSSEQGTGGLLGEYSSREDDFHAFEQKLCKLLRDLLDEQNVRVHSVTGRVKAKASIEGKLVRKEGKYKSLAEMTDIVGVRIITYFEEDVDRVARVVEEEFSVDSENSIDRRSAIDPDRFGYLSLHYVVMLSDGRGRLPEYKHVSDLKAEIQIRSILQHTWAEIEHDLGYKSADGIPREARRRFSRLAGLLELADQEFTSLRRQLREYEKEVPARIERDPYQVGLDILSLHSFLESSALAHSLDLVTAKIQRVRLDESYQSKFLDRLSEQLQQVGIVDIGNLTKLLSENKEFIPRFAQALIDGTAPDVRSTRPAPRGISLIYVYYIRLIYLTDDVGSSASYLRRFYNNEDYRTQLAARVRDAFRVSTDEQK